MLRHSLILVLLGWAAGSAAAETKAESFFDHRAWDLGTVPRAMTFRHSFQVTNTTDHPIRIGSVRGSCGCIYGSAAKQELAPGEKTTIDAVMESRQFSGIVTKTIYVLVDQEEVRIHVQANVVGDLSISPSSLRFGKVKKGTSQEVSVTVSFAVSPSYTMEKVTSESSYVKVKMEPMPENSSVQSYRVTAKINPDLPVGNWYSTISIAGANVGQQPINIPLTVEIVP